MHKLIVSLVLIGFVQVATTAQAPEELALKDKNNKHLSAMLAETAAGNATDRTPGSIRSFAPASSDTVFLTAIGSYDTSLFLDETWVYFGCVFTSYESAMVPFNVEFFREGASVHKTSGIAGGICSNREQECAYGLCEADQLTFTDTTFAEVPRGLIFDDWRVTLRYSFHGFTVRKWQWNHVLTIAR